MAQVCEAPWTFASAWGARGHVTQLAVPGPGSPASSSQARTSQARTSQPRTSTVHWVEFGTCRAGPPIVFVHGLGGSHLNWALTGPELGAGRRAVAVDLHGFGLTPGTRETATVLANTALLDRFVRAVTGLPVILVGNSMGGLVSILQAHAHPETVAGLVLISPALPPARQRPDWAVSRRFLLYATPALGEYYLRVAQARLPARVVVRRVIEQCFADPSRADPALVEAAIALAEHRRSMPGGDASLLAAARSLMRVVAQRRRYAATMAAIGVPVLLIGGEADRLVPAASVRRAAILNPAWDSLILPGVGHTAQLETPGLVIAAIRDWLGQHRTLAAH